jgi:nickel/cobalt transporter (NicO) family protein
MRRALMLAGLAVAVVLAVLWLTGSLDQAARLVQGAQRAVQDQLAGAIRALRAGEPGALVAFWTVCFGYGLLHAAGPGHGKLVIGGYALARRVPVGRLAGLALAASLAQAVVAVVLVYALLAVLGFGRSTVEGVADRWITPVGHALIAGLGLWLIWRGVRGLTATADRSDGHHHDHAERGHDHGPHCDRAHGPTLDQVENVRGWRDGLALVGGIAMRPCSGALLVLVLTWQLGIAAAGVFGAFAMGLGTAVVTVGAALLAVWAREGALQGLGGARFARALPLVELAVGAAIAVVALGLLIGSL